MDNSRRKLFSAKEWLLFAASCLASISVAYMFSDGARNFGLSVAESGPDYSIHERPKGQLKPEPQDGEAHSDTDSASLPAVSTANDFSSYSPAHVGLDAPICTRPLSLDRADVERQIFYQWVNEEGNISLSDKPPKDVIAQVVDLSGVTQNFRISFVDNDIAVPASYRGAVSRSTEDMYALWHFFLGESRLRQAIIDVEFMTDPAEFHALYMRPGENREKLRGLYSHANNKAYVLIDPANPADREPTLIHEVSHVVTAAHLGATAPWLTEGLATYFQIKSIQDSGERYSAKSSHMETIAKRGAMGLEQLLALDHADWALIQGRYGYANAWSLIEFLLATPAGKNALRKTVKWAEQNLCEPFAIIGVLADVYPGGLVAMEKNWLLWVQREMSRY